MQRTWLNMDDDRAHTHTATRPTHCIVLHCKKVAPPPPARSHTVDSCHCSPPTRSCGSALRAVQDQAGSANPPPYTHIATARHPLCGPHSVNAAAIPMPPPPPAQFLPLTAPPIVQSSLLWSCGRWVLAEPSTPKHSCNRDQVCSH